MNASLTAEFRQPQPDGFSLDGRFLPHWVLTIAKVLLASQIVLLVLFVAGTHGLLVEGVGPNSTDFVSFNAAGVLAHLGNPAAAYDRAAHYAVEQALTEPGIPYQYFFYPPIFLLLCEQFARMPYLVSFMLFETATLGFWLLALGGILRMPSREWLAPMLCFPCVFWTMGLGQNAFLTAGLFAAGTLLLDRRPLLAGIILGMLCYKPHFGLLLPVAFIAGHRWRSFAGASLSVATMVGLTLLAYGTETWQAYLAAALDSQSIYEQGIIDFTGFITPFGAARSLGISVIGAHVIQGITAACGALSVGYVWQRRTSLPVRAATIAAATLFSVHLALIYDLLLVTVAIAWLLHAASRTGFLPGEKFVIASVYPLALLTRHAGEILNIPLGPVIVGAILVLCLRRARHEIRARAGTADQAIRPEPVPA